MAVKNVIEQSLTDNVTLEKIFQNRNNYDTELKLQRPVVWSVRNMSKYIESLILGYLCPPLEINKVGNTLRVIDGKNRFTSIVRYLGNEYALSDDVSDISLYNAETDSREEYVIRGKKFKDLDQKVKNHLLTRMVRMDILDNAPESVETETMLRLNSGISMIGILKSRLINHDKDMQSFVNDIVEMELFRRKVNIQENSKNKASHEALIYSIIAIECGLENVGITNYVRISEQINDNDLLTDDIKDTVISTFKAIDSVFPAKSKILSIPNIIPLYLLFKDLEINDEREALAKLERLFKDNEFLDEYKKYLTSTTKNNLIHRAEVIKKHYESV